MIKHESNMDYGCSHFVEADVFIGAYGALRLNFFSAKIHLLYYSLQQERVMRFFPRAQP